MNYLKFPSLRLLISSALVLSFFACVTIQIPTSKVRLDTNAPYSSLRSLVADTPSSAVPLIEKYYESTLINEEEKTSLTRLALERMEQEFDEARVKQNVERVLSLFASMSVLGFDNNDQAVVEDVFKELIGIAKKNGNYPLVTRLASQFFALSKEMTKEPTADQRQLHATILEDIYPILELFPDPILAHEVCGSTVAKISALYQGLCDETTGQTIEDLLKSSFVVEINRGIDLVQGGIQVEIGSGFFITKDGYALTNFHVVESELKPEFEGYTKMVVRLPQDDYTPRKATIVGYDPSTDLALIKVDVKVEEVFYFDDSESYAIGAPVFTLGAPAGLQNTLTSGILSARDRRVLTLGGVLQVDAPVNFGSSGGALLNERYKTIGVIFSKVSGFEGLNFAIPSATVLEVLPRLFSEKEVMHPWMGIGVTEHENRGLEVLFISPQGPADKANLKENDVITHVDGSAVENLTHLQIALLHKAKGQLVSLRVIREGRIIDGVLVSLGLRNASPFDGFLSKRYMHKIAPLVLGSEITVLNSRRAIYRVEKVYLNSAAYYANLKPGDTVRIRSVYQSFDNVAYISMRISRQALQGLDNIFTFPILLNSQNFI